MIWHSVMFYGTVLKRKPIKTLCAHELEVGNGSGFILYEDCFTSLGKSLSDGTAWFGSVESYIQKAQKDHNDEQGDEFEGIFARVWRLSDALIGYMKKFGDELEIIPDGEYCLLRRKSVRKACIFCMYGLTSNDFKPVSKPYYKDGVEVCDFEHSVNQKMFDGF